MTASVWAVSSLIRSAVAGGPGQARRLDNENAFH